METKKCIKCDKWFTETETRCRYGNYDYHKNCFQETKQLVKEQEENRYIKTFRKNGFLTKKARENIHLFEQKFRLKKVGIINADPFDCLFNHWSVFKKEGKYFVINLNKTDQYGLLYQVEEILYNRHKYNIKEI